MTKSQILAQIAASAGIKVALDPIHNETIDNIKWYSVPVLETDEVKSLGWKKSISFYVVDEGTGTEAAYFYKDSPKQDLPVANNVVEAIKAYIFTQANVINYNLLSYNETVNGSDIYRSAVVEVYIVVDGTTANKKSWVIYNKNVGAIAHRVIA